MTRPTTTLFMLMSVDGKDTATLIDGKSLLSEDELSLLGVMKLVECKVLKDSYLRLRYEVVK